jgi:hypothetical protein
MPYTSEGVQIVGLHDYHYYQMTITENNFNTRRKQSIMLYALLI